MTHIIPKEENAVWLPGKMLTYLETDDICCGI